MLSVQCIRCSHLESYLFSFYRCFLLILGDRPDLFNNVERVLAVALLSLGACLYAVVVSQHLQTAYMTSGVGADTAPVATRKWAEHRNSYLAVHHALRGSSLPLSLSPPLRTSRNSEEVNCDPFLCTVPMATNSNPPRCNRVPATSSFHP